MSSMLTSRCSNVRAHPLQKFVDPFDARGGARFERASRKRVNADAFRSKLGRHVPD